MTDRSNTTLVTVLVIYSVLLLAALIAWLGAGWANGDLGVALVVVTAPIALLQTRGAAAPAESALAADMQRAADAMQSLAEESGLSEAAKRVLHRRQERELLRKSIEQDIHDRDYDAAMILVKELAERFGYRTDAEEFRGRIERARAETLEAQVSEALRSFEAMLNDQRWADAHAEAGRISRLFPESPRVEGLHERVASERDRYKQDLERKFLEAAQREETDRAMELLKQLDAYLAPEEAERLQEVARGVIGRAKDNLGVRFKLLVQDRSWRDAVQVAEQIIRDFPNSKMAEEVREVLDTLRERAARVAATQRVGG